jgi:hypothetical protein
MNSEYSDDKNKIAQVHDSGNGTNRQTQHVSNLLKKFFISISSLL